MGHAPAGVSAVVDSLFMTEGVVITGVGVVSGLGVGAEALWEGFCAGRSAIGPVRSFDASGFGCRLAAEFAELSAKDHLPKSYRKFVKVMARDSEIAAVAAHLAVTGAGLATRECDGSPPTYPSGRVACHIGAGLISAEVPELTRALATATDEQGRLSLRAWGQGAMGNLPPLWMLKYLPNMLACHVTIVHGCEGPSNTITCGEVSALLSIGESMRVIERGDADAGFAGGAESKINFMGFKRLELAGRLACTGEGADPASWVRPYDPEAPGQVLGEGGGIFVLEREGAARARGAAPWARLSGFGAAHSPDGLATLDPAAQRDEANLGLVDAVERALADAGVGPDDIDAIVPHAPAERRLDAVEAEALRRVFAGRLERTPLITWTPNVGECMAADGGIQAALAALAVRSQRLPARLHTGTPPGDILAGRADSEEAPLRHVLVCASSLGGSNAALVVSAIER